MPPVQNTSGYGYMEPVGAHGEGHPQTPAPCEMVVRDVVRGMGDLQYNAGASMTDLIFLRGLLESPQTQSLLRAHDLLDPQQGGTAGLAAVGGFMQRLIGDVSNSLSEKSAFYQEADTLLRLLNSPHMQAVAHAHDVTYNRDYGDNVPDDLDFSTLNLGSSGNVNGAPPPTVPVRVIGVKKIAGEPLGVTLRVDDASGLLKVTRILNGGIVDRQGLLSLGDTVLEINGLAVNGENIVLPPGSGQTGGKTRVVEYLKNFTGTDITFKVQPHVEDERVSNTPMYVRALFSYDPNKDDLLPSADLGLSFNAGDILEVTESQNDPNWWQARKFVDGDVVGRSRLIPSEVLEERRQAYARPDLIETKKLKYGGLTSKKRKRKELYSATKNADFDRLDLMFYEEVARMPPFARKTLVLIGTTGVGRRSLKNALVNTYPKNFATPLPTTSRPPREGEVPGRSYNFMERSVMDEDIRNNRYLEYGEFQGNYYGTCLSSIHEIIESGRMCVLDCSPQALKILRTSDFMPFVVLVASPSFERLREMRGNDNQVDSSTTTLSRLNDRELRKTVEDSAKLESDYAHFIDLKIVNKDAEITFRTLCEAISALSVDMQWIPVSWVY